MKNWGFTIPKANQINFNNNSLELYNKVIEREPSLLGCIFCGSCTATCSTGSFTYFSLRNINISLQRGETNHLKEIISKCMLCGKCQLVCPRNVNTRNVLLSLMDILNNN